MRIARCDTCGAPLRFLDGATEVVCGYCQHTTSWTAVPTSIERPPASGRESYVAGEAVHVEWGGRHWPGRVLAVVGPDAYRIHYDGYSGTWDEVVGPDRLEPMASDGRLAHPGSSWAASSASRRAGGRLARPGLAMAAAVVIAFLVPITIAIATFFGNGRPAEMPPPELPEAARPIPPGQVLPVGRAVFVRWRGRWYPAEILSVSSDTTYRIHYTGWSSSWDEDVDSHRIRVP